MKVVDCERISSVLRRSIQHLVPIKAGTKSDTEENTPIHVDSRSSEAPVSSSNDTTKNVCTYLVDLVVMLQWLEKSTVNWTVEHFVIMIIRFVLGFVFRNFDLLLVYQLPGVWKLFYITVRNNFLITCNNNELMAWSMACEWWC